MMPTRRKVTRSKRRAARRPRQRLPCQRRHTLRSQRTSCTFQTADLDRRKEVCEKLSTSKKERFNAKLCVIIKIASSSLDSVQSVHRAPSTHPLWRTRRSNAARERRARQMCSLRMQGKNFLRSDRSIRKQTRHPLWKARRSNAARNRRDRQMHSSGVQGNTFIRPDRSIQCQTRYPLRKARRSNELHEIVVSPRCTHPGCKAIPSFGPIGLYSAKHAILCGKHADRTLHKNVVSPRCTHPGCKAIPSFGPIGLFGSKHAILCEDHADRTLHENVVRARCTHPGCRAIPSFGPIGLFGSKHVILCGKHADRTLHENVVHVQVHTSGVQDTTQFRPDRSIRQQTCHLLWRPCRSNAVRRRRECQVYDRRLLFTCLYT